MSYAATVLARADGRWAGEDVEFTDVEDLDGVVELTRSAAGDDCDLALLFVEENDEWFAVLRLDADDEPRVFLSDSRVVASSDVAALFAEAALDTDDEDDDPDDESEDDEDEGTVADGDPAGDPALLSDLGTPAKRLLALCAKEGQLPSDVISALCESAGCLDVLEQIRGA